MQKGNWELAEAMFSTCVKLIPDNVMYRNLLRNSTKKKYKDNGKGAGSFSKTKLMGIRSRIKKAKAAEEWEEVSKAAEEGLLLNPWDVQLNVELAEAMQALDRSEIARAALFDAVKAAPKDTALLSKFADILEERAEYDEAIKVMERVSLIEPSNLNAVRRITELQTKKTTHRGGYEDAATTRDVSSNKAATRGQVAAPGESVETDLKHAVRKDPQNVDNYVKLAAHLRSIKKYEESLEILTKAVEVSGNDQGVVEQQEDAELLLMKNNVDLAREKADSSDDSDDRKKVAELSIELRNRKIEVLKVRTQRYPANMGMKLELAQLLMQLQQWKESIPLLQKAAQDPRLKGKAQMMLGKCFMYDGKLSMARGQFERAIPELDHEQEPEIFKECHYLLGRVCEDLDDKPAAEKFYGEVLVVDYEYKDALQRLEKIQAG